MDRARSIGSVMTGAVACPPAVRKLATLARSAAVFVDPCPATLAKDGHWNVPHMDAAERGAGSPVVMGNHGQFGLCEPKFHGHAVPAIGQPEVGSRFCGQPPNGKALNGHVPNDDAACGQPIHARGLATPGIPNICSQGLASIGFPSMGLPRTPGQPNPGQADMPPDIPVMGQAAGQPEPVHTLASDGREACVGGTPVVAILVATFAASVPTFHHVWAVSVQSLSNPNCQSIGVTRATSHSPSSATYV